MEINCSDVIEMAIEGEEAASRLQRPNLDLVIVTSRDEEGLCFMEVDAADGTIMFFESIDQCSHTVVPKLDSRGVKGDEDPWSVQVSS